MKKFDKLLKGIKGPLTEEEETGVYIGAQALLNKACEWLEEEAWVDGSEFKFSIDAFRKAMEE